MLPFTGSALSSKFRFLAPEAEMLDTNAGQARAPLRAFWAAAVPPAVVRAVSAVLPQCRQTCARASCGKCTVGPEWTPELL